MAGRIKGQRRSSTESETGELAEEIAFYKFQLVYVPRNSRKALKAYANEKGIRIIGDIPIYVAFDSADTWANPVLFQFDEDNQPKAVAGCPPDAFSATGQLWGNPLYKWDYHKSTGMHGGCYVWLTCLNCTILSASTISADLMKYYSIPFGDQTAERGHWEKGPGMDLFNTVKEKLGDVDVIAEDLGYLTESVIEMVKESGYPGMKVLQFAFDSREESDYLPHNYERNCVVYTGTHDNDTILGWYYVMSEEDREFSKEYMGNAKSTDEELPWDFYSHVNGERGKSGCHSDAGIFRSWNGGEN